MSRRHRASVALAGLALALTAGCGAGDPAPTAGQAAAPPASSPASSQAGEAVVHIQDFGYSVPASVRPGATVELMNMDGEAHTVTADDGSSFDVKVAGGTTGTLTAPTTPGTYAFHCTYHGNMHGVLVVTG